MKGIFNNIKNLRNQLCYYLFTLTATLYTTTFLAIKGTTLISHRTKNLQASALLDDELINEDAPERGCKRKIKLSGKQEEYKSEYKPGFKKFKRYSKKVFPMKKVNAIENLRDLGNLAI